MIGVVANPADHEVVREFFELFKTPWEFYQSGGKYDVVLCDDEPNLHNREAGVVILYCGWNLGLDGHGYTASQVSQRTILHKETRIPIYGNSVTFPDKQPLFLVDAESREAACYRKEIGQHIVFRVGYDLFSEIRTLITAGQPVSNAAIPTLELHIALLRDLLVANGVPFIEIPPVPEGYQFIACLTHDVDHPSMRLHKFDHTMFGFLYRAICGSLFHLLTGRARLRHAMANWGAVLKLPFVYLGLAQDPWLQLRRYHALEPGQKSSFFVIPFRDEPGRRGEARAPIKRAARYGAADIKGELEALVSAGCEIGLHGLDAWCDSDEGRRELDEIRKFTAVPEIGVRMHWLYFDGQSPATLERAGADYDSTFGYNETVGYRAGTAQPYKPLEAIRLLELPLHIMDTALFFPTYLNLSPLEVSQRVNNIVDNAVHFGGAVTINWHDRSIAPERYWDDFYRDLLSQLKDKGAWFATAAETVAWFRMRRAARFGEVKVESDALQVKAEVTSQEGLPALQLRVHNSVRQERINALNALDPDLGVRDFSLRSTIDTCIALV